MANLTPAQATVLAAIISAVVTLFICLINSRQQQKKMALEQQKIAQEIARQEEQRRKDEAVRDAKLEMWMRGVEEKLELHNGYAQKLGEIQTDIAVIKNDIKTLYKQA